MCTDGRCSKWLDRLFIAVDANFCLKRFNISSKWHDPRLNKGFSYFIDDQIVDAHMATFGDKIPEETNMCNDHDAIKMATMWGGQRDGYDWSGCSHM